MAYMGHRYGDYLGGYRGDPGFFSKILKMGGKIVGSFLGLGGTAPAPSYLMPPPVRRTQYPGPGPMGLVRDFGLGAPGPYLTGKGTKMGRPSGKALQKAAALAARGEVEFPRRRMNVANPKALRRAIRRQAGFVKLARRALKGSGYTIVTRGSRKPQLRIQETGPGSVNVQR